MKRMEFFAFAFPHINSKVPKQDIKQISAISVVLHKYVGKELVCLASENYQDLEKEVAKLGLRNMFLPDGFPPPEDTTVVILPVIYNLEAAEKFPNQHIFS